VLEAWLNVVASFLISEGGIRHYTLDVRYKLPYTYIYIESWFYIPVQVSETVSCVVIDLGNLFLPLFLVSLWTLIFHGYFFPVKQEIHIDTFSYT
jgi:branched-subunit amino acid permease